MNSLITAVRKVQRKSQKMGLLLSVLLPSIHSLRCNSQILIIPVAAAVVDVSSL